MPKLSPAFVDFVSFSFPVPQDLSPHRVIARAAANVEQWASTVRVGEVEDKGIYGYSFRSPIIDLETGKSLGFIAAGGSNSGTCFVSITGIGCQHFSMPGIADFLDRVGGRITRVDVAVDDYSGERNPFTVREAYLAGAFISRGQNPTPGQAGPWDDKSKWGQGLTYYVGKRTSGKMLRCYHKGREQGDAESDWVRFEVELRRGDREIGTSALRDPLSAFLGAYEWLEWAQDTQEPRVPLAFGRRLKQRIQLSALCRHAKRSYGKLIFTLHQLGVSHDQIVGKLSSVGKPARLDYRYLVLEADDIAGVMRV